MTSNSNLNSKMESFSEKFLSKVLEIMSNEKFFDTVIKVGNRTFQAHRLVLSACIPYFYQLFSAEEGQSGKKIEIVIKEIDPDVMEAFIDFCYSGEIEINEQNFLKIMSCSKILDVVEIREACMKFVTPQLDARNVLKFKKEAQLNECQNLIPNANEFIFKHFNEIADTETFLEFNLEELLEILGSDQLKVTSEEVVYEAAMKWVKFDEVKRQKFLPQVLQKIRLTLLPVNFLMSVVSKEKLIMNSMECRDLIGRVSMYHLADNKEEFLPGCSTVPRRQKLEPVGVKKYSEKIYAIFDKCIWIYDQEKWSEVGKISLAANVRHGNYDTSIISSSTCALDDKIYVYVKYKLTIYADQMTAFKVFDINTKTQRNLSSIPEKLKNPQFATFKGHIYVCFDDSAFLYKLNDQGKLEEFAAFNQIKKKPKLAASNKFVYLFSENEIATTTERFFLDTKEWTSIPWIFVRKNIKFASIGPKLYVCGGIESNGQISTLCFVYDEKTKKPAKVSSMLIKRTNFQLVAYGGKLYAIGGLNNQNNQFVEYMEEYCPFKDEWKLLPASSQIHGKLHGAGVVAIEN